MIAEMGVGLSEIGMLVLAILFCLAASAAITLGVYSFVRWWDRRREAKKLALRLKQEAEAAAEALKAEEENYGRARKSS
jgi:uncharacterized iron-regulated membrane protein